MRKTFVSLMTALALATIFAFQTDAISFDGDGTYAFRGHQPGDPGTPVTFSSCKPIPVEINLDGVEDPDAAKRLVLTAMGEVSAASGLHLQYAGATTRRPGHNAGSSIGGYAPVLVSFATSDEVPRLGEGTGRGVIGLGGAASLPVNGVETYVTGGATFEVNTFNDRMGRFGGPAEAHGTVLHELGHVVGLAHVQDKGEVMNEHGHRTTELGPGDRRGLARLGKGPCS